MKLQSSFIFLNNIDAETSKNKNEIKHTKSILSYISELFGATKTEKGNLFVKRRYECSMDKCHVLFIISSVGSASYMTISVEGKRNDIIVKCIEKIQQAFDNSKISDEYIIITSYCAVSEYYCNKLYPKLNELERNLRNLLLHIYILKFDNDFYSHCMDIMSGETQENVKKVMRTKSSIKRKQNLFYSMDFGQLQELLFTQKWTDVEESEKQQIFDDNPDLSMLSDEELRNLISNIKPKSEWERIFSDKIETDFAQKNIRLVSRERNKVAHSKLLTNEEYLECNKLINELNKEIEIAITLTEDEEFIRANEEAISKALGGILTTFSNFMQNTVKPLSGLFEKSGIKTTIETLGKLASANYNDILPKINPNQ